MLTKSKREKLLKKSNATHCKAYGQKSWINGGIFVGTEELKDMTDELFMLFINYPHKYVEIVWGDTK